MLKNITSLDIIKLLANCSFFYIQIIKDKSTPTKDREASQQIRPIVEDSRAAQTSTNNMPVPSITSNVRLPTPRIPQPIIDVTDRRQIEAQNEVRSHTTKETLDDIKHIHYEEKKKLEQNDIETYQLGTYSEGRVSEPLIID